MNGKRLTMTLLAGLVSVSMLSGCGNAKLDGTKTVATVNGDKISMGTLSLFARYQQARTEAMYASIFGASGYQYSIWSSSAGDEEDAEKTYGDVAVENALRDLELATIMKQKAADYGVEVSAEDMEKINAAAEAFMAANTEETISELAASKDDVAAFLELETYESRFYDPVVADADITVDPEEAQQSSYTYVLIEHDEEAEEAEADEEMAEDAEETADAAEETAEEAADAAEEAADAVEETSEEAAEAAEEAADAVEETTEEATEAVEETTEEAAETAEEAVETADAEEAADAVEETAEETADAAEETAEDAADAAEETADAAEETAEEEAPSYDAATKAQMLLDKMKADPAADMTAAASEIDSALTSRTDSFTTKDTENTYLTNSQDAAVIEALRTLSDGQVYDGIVETEEGYYVLRLDLVNDEEETQSKIESVQTQIKDEFYQETTDKWIEEASITVDDKVLKNLKVTDLHTFTMVQDEEEEAETEAAEETVEATTEAGTETTSEAAAEAATEAASEAATEGAAEAATEGAAEVTTEAAVEITTEAAVEAVTE